MKVAVVQQAMSGDRSDNIERSIQGIRDATAKAATLILLPELHATRYFCQTEDAANFDLAEPIPGPTTQQLGKVAAECGVTVIGSVFERRSAGVFHNTAVVIGPDGEIAGRYRKAHIPDDPGFHEKFHFAPGDGDFQPIEIGGVRIGVLVCWDQWFPEAARILALRGADLLVYPSAIGWDPADDEQERNRQRDAWVTVMRGHAIANVLPVIASNRCGHEPDPNNEKAENSTGIRFWGNSFICGPQGEMLATAGESPEVLLADIDMTRTDTLRRIWPFFRDRRIDAYGGLGERFIDDS